MDLDTLVPGGLGTYIATEWAWVFWGLAAAYVPAVFWLQRWMATREKFNLRKTMIAWNVALSALSLAGFVVMTVQLGRDLWLPEYFEETFPPATRLVTMLFCLTKSVEYGDTVWLVLTKKPLITLHVWHHLTVALYCWHAQRVGIGFGHLFCYINLFIHGIMYAYYAASIAWRGSRIIRRSRSIITGLQIAQMVVGVGVTLWATRALQLSAAHTANCNAALLMYISYLYLFAVFYLQNYMPHAKYPHVQALAFTAAIATFFGGALSLFSHIEPRSLATGAAILVALVCAYHAPRQRSTGRKSHAGLAVPSLRPTVETTGPAPRSTPA